ncbi:MAG: hypothetical protein Q8L36_02930 [bacterium]|nr:hypothetical protein [bacterium]
MNLYLFRENLWPATVFAAAFLLGMITHWIGWKPYVPLTILGILAVCLNFQRNSKKDGICKFFIWILNAAATLLAVFILTEISEGILSGSAEQRFAIIALILGTASIFFKEEFRWRIWPLFILVLIIQSLGLLLFFRGFYPNSFSFGVLVFVICYYRPVIEDKMPKKKIPELDPEDFIGI